MNLHSNNDAKNKNASNAQADSVNADASNAHDSSSSAQNASQRANASITNNASNAHDSSSSAQNASSRPEASNAQADSENKAPSPTPALNATPRAAKASFAPEASVTNNASNAQADSANADASSAATSANKNASISCAQSAQTAFDTSPSQHASEQVAFDASALFTKNLSLFEKRFPELYASTPKDLLNTGAAARQCGFCVTKSKSGDVTASVGGFALHSSYNPVRESEKLVQSGFTQSHNAAVFMGFGLGYAPIEFVKANPQKTLVLIESDLSYLLAALTVVDWTPVFLHASCVFLIGAPTQTIIAVLEKIGIDNCTFFRTKSQTAHNPQYFDSIQSLIERNRQKKEINERTLERFSRLWLRNMCKNLSYVATLDGVNRYKDAFTEYPACVIAAGPSLDDALPQLAKIHERCITVCVDTALRACLKAGIEPDFIVSVDPQYWNVRHLDGISAPKSTLITELASYPPTFRFNCKKTVLCSSLYPLGKFIEKRIGEKGELGAGGSVATTAWDFARMCGCKTIYMAGLDLGFPNGKTHFKGSTFEEKTHQNSHRLHTAETDAFNALYGAYPYAVSDYNGKSVLTDTRLALYAWWFESKTCAYPSVKTKTLSPNGIKIPGIEYEPIESVLSLPVIKKDEVEDSKILSPLTQQTADANRIATHADPRLKQKRCTLQTALSDAERQLNSIKYNAQKAADLCKKGLAAPEAVRKISAELSAIDAAILQNDAAELASLVFPGEKQLSLLIAGTTHPLEQSLIVYRAVIDSVNTHLRYLAKAR